MEIKVLGHDIEVSDKVLTAPNNEQVTEYINDIEEGRKLLCEHSNTITNKTDCDYTGDGDYVKVLFEYCADCNECLSVYIH